MVLAKPTPICSFDEPVELPRKNREALADSFTRLCERALLVTAHAAKHSNVDHRTLATLDAALRRAQTDFSEAMQ